MNNGKKLKEFSYLFLERERLQNIVSPHLRNLENVNKKITEWGRELTLKEKEFISNKLMERFSKEHIENIYKQREERKKMFENANAFYDTNYAFDPYNEEWHIHDIQFNKGLIKLKVSCTRKEGHISGIYTFLDLYDTKWFDIKELENV